MGEGTHYIRYELIYMKTMQKWIMRGERIGAMDSKEELVEFASKFGVSGKVEMITHTILEDGDKVKIEKIVGAIHDENGISSGGSPKTFLGTVVNCMGAVCQIVDDDGKLIQTTQRDINTNGYPILKIEVVA